MVGLFFPLVALLFFRNSPEESGLQANGDYVPTARKKKFYFRVIKEFTLRETVRSYAFWVFALMLAMQGLYIIGFTFHVVSGMIREAAITIFQPVAVLAVALTLASSSLSDYIPLKYLLYLKGLGACMGIVDMIFLGTLDMAYTPSS